MSTINKPECALRLLLAKSCPVVDEELRVIITHCVSGVEDVYTLDNIVAQLIMQVLHVLSILVFHCSFMSLRFVIYLCD